MPLTVRLDEFKYFLGESFGLDSDRYEHVSDYEQYVRVAAPGFEAIRALVGKDQGPHHIISHEFMGMPLALKAIMEGVPGNGS